MRRITAAEVHKAYKKTGRKPVRGYWTNGNSCCPQWALATSRGTSDPSGWADRVYGAEYAEGFRQGFDGTLAVPNRKGRHYLGFLDGRRIARALGYTTKPFKVAS